MFCLYTSSKLSRPKFEFSLNVKVDGIEYRPPFKIFSTLKAKKNLENDPRNFYNINGFEIF